QWLDETLKIRRDPFPRHVTFKTPSLRYAQAYWLRIDGIQRGLALAEVDGEQSGGAFTVRATNVDALSLLLDPARVPPAGPIAVTIDGAVAYQGPPRPVLAFARGVDGGGAEAWKPRGDAPAPARALPEHGAAGLFSRALARERAQLYVYGTAGKPDVTAAG